MTDEAKPYKWQRDARANNAEAAVQFERARAEAAEAQRDRLAEALEEVTKALGHIDDTGLNVVFGFITRSGAAAFLARFEAARAALADVPDDRATKALHPTLWISRLRRRDEAYRAMRDALSEVVDDEPCSPGEWCAAHNRFAPCPMPIGRAALALARQVEE